MLDACVDVGARGRRCRPCDRRRQRRRRRRRRQGVELIRPPRNLGFGAGANVGFRRAAELGATSVALLNDDIEVEIGWLGPLRTALTADAALGAVQPKLLLAGSDPARVNSVGVVVGTRWRRHRHRLRRGRRPAVRRPTGRSTPFTGGAVLFRSTFLKQHGGFDESYFLYYEDLDLARPRCGPRLDVPMRPGQPGVAQGQRIDVAARRPGPLPAGAEPAAIRVPLRRSRHGGARTVAVDPAGSLEPARRPRQGIDGRPGQRPRGARWPASAPADSPTPLASPVR